MCSSPHMLASYIFLLLHVLFGVDILLSFRVAFHENEALVSDPARTARNYLRRVTAHHLSTPTPSGLLILLESLQRIKSQLYELARAWHASCSVKKQAKQAMVTPSHGQSDMNAPPCSVLCD